MIGGPSRDTLHDDGPSAEAARLRPARLRHASARGIRFLQLLALAIVTLVCAAVTSPARGVASLAVPIAVAARDGASAARSASATQPSHQLRHAPRRVADLKAVEIEIEDDDDGDPRSDLADAQAAAVTATFPGASGRALCGASQIEPSRFAIATALPRGPPV